MQKPIISIILPVYNEPQEWVTKCIDSIINQTFKEFQLIVVLDNPNNIELKELIEDYIQNDHRIVFVVNKINLGLPETLNKAIKLCDGQYIARIDADDICLLERLEKQYNYLINNPDIDLIGCKISKIDEDSNEINYIDRRVLLHKNIAKSLVYGQPIAHPTWMGKKEAFERIKYTNLLSVEDIDFLCRAVLNGFKLANMQDTLLKYRVRTSSISNKNSLKQLVYTRYIGKAFKDSFYFNREFNIEKVVDINVSDDVILKFRQAEDYLSEFNLAVKEGKFLNGISKLLLAILTSKYFRYKLFRRIMLNLIIRKEKGLYN